MISFAGRTVGLGSIFTHPLLAVYITETYWFVPLASSSGKWRFIGITDPKNAKILVVTSQHHHGKGCPTQVIYQVHVVLLDVLHGLPTILNNRTISWVSSWSPWHCDSRCPVSEWPRHPAFQCLYYSVLHPSSIYIYVSRNKSRSKETS